MNDQPTESQSPDDIRDPEAYWQAQAEKWQRLAQKIEAEAEAVRQQADQERIQRLREDAARQVNLPPEAADRLRGSTAEEINADAQALAALLPSGRIGNSAADGEPDLSWLHGATGQTFGDGGVQWRTE